MKKILLICFIALQFINISYAKKRNAVKDEEAIKSSPWDMAKRNLTEMKNLRSKTAKHFLKQDGKVAMFISPTPIHYLKNGNWEEIDLDIKSSSKFENHPYANTGNAFKTYYPDNLDNSIITELKEGKIEERIIGFNAQDNSGLNVQAFRHGTNGKSATLNNNIIIYNDVLQDVDAQYIQAAESRIFNLQINSSSFVNSIQANAKYFVVNEELTIPNSWTVTKNEDGILIHDGNTLIASIPNPLAYEKNASADAFVNGTIDFEKNGTSLLLKSKYPTNWLKNANRNFPLVLDPIINFYPPNPGVSMATGYMTTAAGAKTNGLIRLAGLNTFGWAKFDITSLPLAAIGINAATYWGYHYSGSNTGVLKQTPAIGLQALDPVVALNTAIVTQINGGPSYNASFNFGGNSAFGWYSASLGGTATTDIFSQFTSQGWTALGFKYITGNTGFMYQYGGANQPPAAGLGCYLEIDYILPPCTGMPVAGTPNVTLDTVCGSQTTTFSVTGYSTASSTVLQWQESPTGLAGSWTDILGANAATYTTAPQVGPTTRYYRMHITCTPSLMGDTTVPITLEVGVNPTVGLTASPTSVCMGSPSTLDASTTVGAASYSWTPAATLNVSTGAVVIATPTAPLTSYVVTASDAVGCTASSAVAINAEVATMTVTPVLSSICVGTSTNINVVDSAYSTGPQISPSGYCAGEPTSTADEDLGNFTMGTINNTTNCATPFAGSQGVGVGIANRYTDFTASVPPTDLIAGNTYSYSATSITCGGNFTNSMRMWIDYNRDGDFNDPGEFVVPYTAAQSAPGPHVMTGSITIPLSGVVAGLTRLRVMSLETSAAGAPCNPVGTSWGETEDYVVNLIAKVPAQSAASAPYTYTWSPAVTNVTANGDTVTAGPIMNTTIYTVTATSANMCTRTATVTITADPLANISATTTPGLICASDSAQHNVTLTGGGLPYSYSWSPTLGLSDPLISNPKASPGVTTTYTVTVTDACLNTITSTVQLFVINNPIVNATSTNAIVCDGNSTTLNATGSATYTWMPGSLSGAMQSLTPTASNVYTVTGTDANGCTGTSSVAFTYVAPFYDTTGNDAAICLGGSANLIAGDSIPPVPVGCVPTYSSGTGFGDYIQSISGFLNNVTGANPSPYYTNYASPTATLTAGTPYVLNVTTGTYSANDVALWIDYNNNGTFDPIEKIGEFDNLGASGVATFNVTVPLSTNNGTIKLRIVEADQGTTGGMLPCAAYSFGETEDYTITITGGVPVISPVYTYTWMPGSLSGAAQTVTPAATTIYTVTQTDANGCTATATQVVTVNPNPTTTVTATTVASCVPGCDATATMNATGGTSPYAYTVSASATTVGNNVVGICAATTYTVTATDANGCIGTVTTMGVQATNPIVTATPAAVNVCQNAMTTLIGGGATTYSWSGSITNNTPFAVTASTIYTVTGTDAMGCSATATSDVTMLALPTVTATPAAVSVCQNAMTTLVGGGASTYSWSGGITDNTPFAVTASTVYTVTGTDASGCSNTATSDVTMTAAPVITATPNTVNNCVGSSTDLTASGGLNYVWMPGSVSGSMLTVPAYTGSGTYTVTGTDAGGCSATATAVVTNTLPSGDLTQAGLGNSSSITGNQCKSTTHPNDGQPLAYFDNSCQIIASVQEPNGGLNLGPVNTCVTIDPSVQLVNGQPYARRWFEITPTTNGPATVSLYLTLADFLDYNAAPAAAGWPLLPTTASSTDPNIPNIRVTKNDAGILSVITPTVSYDVVNSRFVLTFPVSGFSQFRVHSVNAYNAPLPVTYKSFTARKENTVDVLDWTTGSEENNKQFNVERSANGEDFTKIGVVATKAPNGNSQVDINYTFVDEKPLTGHNYYRLAQEDIDGKINYSKTIDLIWGSNGTISMYPNPTSGLLNVEINVEKSSNITIRVMDMSGRTVKTTEAKAVQGVNKVELNLNDVSSGIYNVQVIENGKLIVTNRVNKK